jgi:hypothetical protein
VEFNIKVLRSVVSINSNSLHDESLKLLVPNTYTINYQSINLSLHTSMAIYNILYSMAQSGVTSHLRIQGIAWVAIYELRDRQEISAAFHNVVFGPQVDFRVHSGNLQSKYSFANIHFDIW